MHDFRIPVYHHVIGDFHRADLGSAEIVAYQIDQHIVLGKLLLIGKQLVLERLILLRRFCRADANPQPERWSGGRYPVT